MNSNKAAFFGAMRHPALKPLREILKDLTCERGLWYQRITAIEVQSQPWPDQWVLLIEYDGVPHLITAWPPKTIGNEYWSLISYDVSHWFMTTGVAPKTEVSA